MESFQSADHSVLIYLIFKILLGAVIAFFMEVTEVMVVTYTSSLTLSIAGIFKVGLTVHLYDTSYSILINTSLSRLHIQANL